MDKVFTSPVFTRNDYTIGWVCALSTELTAATAMLDSKHDLLNTPPRDKNNYTLGSIGKHNIVIACLPKGKQGTTSAAVVATQMLESFPSVKFGLMIGVGGGIPCDDHDIRLGDVVVSTPTSSFPGVVQWDMGKAEEGSSFERIGSLNNPPRTLLTALQRLETQHEMEGSIIEELIDEMMKKWPRLKLKYARPDSLKDILFASDNAHQQGTVEKGQPGRDKESCSCCDITKSVEREQRDDATMVHYGLIASGNKVIKDAILRDKLNNDLGGNVLCVEMEAAGLMDTFPCLVIRGICDYADSHKNDTWQGYAAATAAAFAKELLSVIPAQEVKKMKKIKLIASKIVEISENVKKIHQDQERHARNEIMEWLTPINYDAQHHEHLSQRSPESGKWIFKNPNFQQFLNGDEKTLLCQGNPGAGKTILTSAVIEHLQHQQPGHDAFGYREVILAFIYFDFIRKESQKTIDILASLIKQLVRDEPYLSTAIEDLQSKYRDIPASSRSDKDIPEFSKILKHLINDNSKQTFIVIDALDECQNADTFLAEIFKIIEDTEAKLFATTRPNKSIEKRFKNGLFLEISAAVEDVENYIKGRLSEFKVLSDENVELSQKLRRHLKREIVSKISSAIDGIFLLAKFHMDSLRAKTTPAQIRRTLEVLPRGPHAYRQAYEKTISRIRCQQSENRQLARRTLQWLACAAREFTALELRQALAIKSDSGLLPSEEEFESTIVMVEVCMGLVIVEKESGIIRLLHHTALEYLQQNMTCIWSLEHSETLEAPLPAPKTPKDAMNEAHQAIARVCIKHLSSRDIPDSFIFQHISHHVKYPFCCYAKKYWAYHWNEGLSEISVPDSMRQITAAFLRNKFMAALISPFSIKDIGTMTMLHFVAFFGLTSMIDICLTNGDDIHATTSAGENALWFALMGNHEGTSKALLKRGSKEAVVAVDDFKRNYLSSLNLAIKNKMRIAVDLLLDNTHDARVNPEKEKEALYLNEHPTMTALLASAENGNADMTNSLLLHGADVKDRVEGCFERSRPYKWLPPIISAAANGDVEMVEMLLARGADIHAKYAFTACSDCYYPEGATAFTIAAMRGNDAVIKSLLRVNIIAVNEEDEECKTPFYWAICEGNISTANIIMRNGGKLYNQGTNLDPGLPAHVSLINGKPSLIRVWGFDNVHIDITHDLYDAFEDSGFLQNFLTFYSTSPSTLFIPCRLAKTLDKAIAWGKYHTSKYDKAAIRESHTKLAQEVEGEGLWGDLIQLAIYLDMPSLKFFAADGGWFYHNEILHI
ncbi:hypothetical protein GGI43DRAFT_404805 [Trichoderma evansii]